MARKKPTPNQPTNLRQQAEALLRTSPREIDGMPDEDIRAIVHELQVHQIELEMQNEELHASQLHLQEARDKYLDLFEFAPVGYLSLNSEGVILEGNLTAAGMLGVERVNLVGHKFSDFVHRASQDSWFLHREETLAKSNKQTCELRLSYSGLPPRWLRLDSNRLSVSSPPSLEIRTALTDISGIKLAETTRAIVLVLDTKGRILRFNRYFETISGYRLDELQGKSWLHTCITKEHHSSVRNHFKSALASDTTSGYISPIRTRNGHQRLIEWFDSPLTDGQGKLLGLLRSGQDVTERIALEQQIVQAGDERQQRIAQDLHDGLGSHLNGTALLCQSLVRSLESRSLPEAADANRLSRLLQEAIQQCRQVARGLYPVEEDPEGLLRALQKLAEEKRHLKIQCRILCQHPIRITDSSVANHLFHIAQEAVNNAIRHGKARLITLRLAQSKNNVELRIRDNGKGMPKEAFARTGGLGLKTMSFRAKLINGRLDIKPAPRRGLEVNCSIPCPPGA